MHVALWRKSRCNAEFARWDTEELKGSSIMMRYNLTGLEQNYTDMQHKLMRRWKVSGSFVLQASESVVKMEVKLANR